MSDYSVRFIAGNPIKTWDYIAQLKDKVVELEKTIEEKDFAIRVITKDMYDERLITAENELIAATVELTALRGELAEEKRQYCLRFLSHVPSIGEHIAIQEVFTKYHEAGTTPDELWSFCAELFAKNKQLKKRESDEHL